MFHKGIPYDSLLKMDVETLNELLERIKEQNEPSKGQRLTQQQKDMLDESKNMKW